MNTKRLLGIASVLLVAAAGGCSESATRIEPTTPSFENGGSYGSGGRSGADSTASPAGAQQTDGNGGSYGSGG
jgi:hypothetical protein